jgi:hypothetical protein
VFELNGIENEIVTLGKFDPIMLGSLLIVNAPKIIKKIKIISEK